MQPFPDLLANILEFLEKIYLTTGSHSRISEIWTEPKEEIGLELNNGYLIVSANKGLDKDEKDKKGKLIRQERYSGSMQRSFYVGENITEEDIKASFKHGVLLCLRV